MGLNLDFRMTEQQKKLAAIGGILAAIIAVLVLWLMLKPKNYDNALNTLTKIEAAGRAATAEELIQMGDLIKHPDQEVRQRVNTLYSTAEPVVVNQMGDNYSALPPAVRQKVIDKMVETNPAKAIELTSPALLSADRDSVEQAAMVVAAAAEREPSAIPQLAGVLDGNDETNRRRLCDLISARPNLAKVGAGFMGKLEKIANDPNESEGMRIHAQRALAKIRNPNAPDIGYPGVK